MTRLVLLTLSLLLTLPFAAAQQVPVTTDSDDARIHYTRGVDAAMFVNFAQARSHFEAALADDPDFAMAHVYLAVLSGGEQRTEHLRQATAAAANASEGERQMIASYAANVDGDHDQEGTLLTTVAERHPDDPMPMFWWANTEYQRGNHAEAVAAARQSLEADPSFASAYNMMGYAAMRAGDTDTAEEAFQAQIRLAPDYANPYDSYGEFLLSEGRLDEAEAQYKMALTKNPELTNARTMLVRIGIMRGNRAFEAAVASGDGEGVASLYTEGGIAFPPGAPPARGREAIAELFNGYAANGVDGVTLETHEVQTMGNYAHEMGVGRIRVGDEEGEPFNYSVLWMKDGDTWRLHRDIWN